MGSRICFVRGIRLSTSGVQIDESISRCELLSRTIAVDLEVCKRMI